MYNDFRQIPLSIADNVNCNFGRLEFTLFLFLPNPFLPFGYQALSRRFLVNCFFHSKNPNLQWFAYLLGFLTGYPLGYRILVCLYGATFFSPLFPCTHILYYSVHKKSICKSVQNFGILFVVFYFVFEFWIQCSENVSRSQKRGSDTTQGEGDEITQQKSAFPLPL